MTDRPTIPEEYREDIDRVTRVVLGKPSGGAMEAAGRLLAALPPKRPTFTDDEALALCEALWPDSRPSHIATADGRLYLQRLAAAGWTAPPALCPPIPVDEVKRRVLARDDHTKAGGAYAVLDVLRDLNRERGHGC